MKTVAVVVVLFEFVRLLCFKNWLAGIALASQQVPISEGCISNSGNLALGRTRLEEINDNDPTQRRDRPLYLMKKKGTSMARDK